LPDADALQVIERGFAAIAEVHRLMSFHEPGSDVSRLNRAGAGEPVPVDPQTFAVLDQARHMAEISNGIFDITVASDLVAWGFLPQPDGRQPDPAASWRDIELTAPNQVRLHRPLWVDPGGIAKGYAVDRAMQAMALPDDIQCSINAGGDLRIAGPAAERVLLRAPGMGDSVPVLEIENASLASSSGRDDRRELSGRTVGPHLDGATRCSVGTQSFVSVVAEDCMIADALTKIVLAQGAAASDIVKRHNATAYFHDGVAGWQTFGAVN
jgi:thiamine biosynthesis lipoprotein